MQLFYHPEIDSTIILDDIESQHCVKVLRHQAGDEIHVIDGKGKIYKGEIANLNHKRCEVQNMIELRSEPRASHLHIAIAPTKSTDRFEWFVEKATEIGISEITPIKCENSERPRLNTDRLERKAISAIKQNQSLWLPKINPLKSFSDFVNDCSIGQKLIAYVPTKQKSPHLSTIQPTLNQEIAILIGPEGDFSPQEVENAIQKGFKMVSLGNNVLRTETAGIVVAALLST